MEWGPSLDFLQDLEDSGSNPKALESRPILHEWMKEYLVGFDRLNKSRQGGFGPNPILLTEILAYLRLYGASEPDAFVEYIQKMDFTFLEFKAKQIEERNKTQSASQSKARKPQAHGRR